MNANEMQSAGLTEKLAALRLRRRQRWRPRQTPESGIAEYMNLFSPIGPAFMFFYVIFGRVVVGFLLKLYSANPFVVIPATAELHLTSSTATMYPSKIRTVTVTHSTVELDGRVVCSFADDEPLPERCDIALGRALREAADEDLSDASLLTLKPATNGIITLFVDRHTPARTLNRVVGVCRDAGMTRIKLAVATVGNE